MTQAEIDEFVAVVGSFCKYVEGAAQLSVQRRIFEGRKVLAALYAAALELPAPNPAEIPNDFERARVRVQVAFGDHDLYWMIFDPTTQEEPTAATLSDDFGDIYTDLGRGLFVLGRDGELAALGCWRFYFDIHWGAHALNALRALHAAAERCVEPLSLDPLLRELRGQPWIDVKAMAIAGALMDGLAEVKLDWDKGVERWIRVGTAERTLLMISTIVPLMVSCGLDHEKTEWARIRCTVLEVEGFDDKAFTASEGVLESVFGPQCTIADQPFSARDLWYHTVT